MQSLATFARLLAAVLRRGLGLAFAWAGALKAADPDALAATIGAFGLLPGWLVRPLALGLPPLEMAAGLALVLGLPLGLEVVSGLLVVFMAVLAKGIAMGLDIDCGCYGPADPESRAFGGLRATLWRDAFMLAAAGLCRLGPRRNLLAMLRGRPACASIPKEPKESLPCA